MSFEPDARRVQGGVSFWSTASTVAVLVADFHGLESLCSCQRFADLPDTTPAAA